LQKNFSVARHKRIRHVCCRPEGFLYKPAGIPMRQLDVEKLTLDEYEAIRLADYEGLYHEQAAQEMGVSRATFGRILEAGRKKLASALINKRAFVVEGGPVLFRAKGPGCCCRMPAENQEKITNDKEDSR